MQYTFYVHSDQITLPYLHDSRTIAKSATFSFKKVVKLTQTYATDLSATTSGECTGLTDNFFPVVSMLKMPCIKVTLCSKSVASGSEIISKYMGGSLKLLKLNRKRCPGGTVVFKEGKN